jgi:hypothetical protein
MFDRVGHAAAGRDGGKPGAAGVVALDDGTKLKPKGWQHVPAGGGWCCTCRAAAAMATRRARSCGAGE